MAQLSNSVNFSASLRQVTDKELIETIRLAYVKLATLTGQDSDELSVRLRESYDWLSRPRLHIEGRRWFQRGPGNTYHSVRIYRDGEMIAHLPYSYGYGDHFLQTALDWMMENGHAPKNAQYGTLYLRETLGGTYSVTDVERKQDL